MCICYIHRILDNITPNHELLAEQSLAFQRQTPFSEKSRPCVKKKPSKPNALLQKKKKSKQIRCLKTKTTTKLCSNVEIFILRTYSGV